MASQPGPFRPFVEVPSTRDRQDFPLTRFLCDLIRDGKTKTRANWKAGKYPGVRPSWARQYAEDV